MYLFVVVVVSEVSIGDATLFTSTTDAGTMITFSTIGTSVTVDSAVVLAVVPAVVPAVAIKLQQHAGRAWAVEAATNPYCCRGR